MSFSVSSYNSLIKKSRDARPKVIKLTEEEHKLKFLYESSFYEFCKGSWHTIHSVQFKDGWHIKAVCDHYQACAQGKIKLLVDNIPIRCMKSTIKVMFVAWMWIEFPWFQFLLVSADLDLLIRDNMQIKDIIKSDWYKKYWGDRYKIRRDEDGKELFSNNKGGVCRVKSILGNITGHNSDCILLDDANSSKDIKSGLSRANVIDIFGNAIAVRINNPDFGFIINQQQRLHDEDLTAYLLRTRIDAVHLCLPMDYDPTRKCRTIVLPGTDKIWEDPRTVKGELLWPNRFPRDYVENIMKPSLGSAYNISAQLQQLPYAAGGNIFLIEWIDLDEFPPDYGEYKYIIQSIDPAFSNDPSACFSAMTTWGVYHKNGKPHVMLLECARDRLEHPQLVRWIRQKRERWMNHQGYVLLIEKSGYGKALIDQLMTYGVMVTAFDPRQYGVKPAGFNSGSTHKSGRAKQASVYFEDGLVSIPVKTFTKEMSPSMKEFSEILAKYPTADGMDYVDSLSQAFLFMAKYGMIIPREMNYMNENDMKNFWERAESQYLNQTMRA